MVTTVVSAAVGALAPLLVKLTALLANEYGRLKGVRSEINSLTCELRSIHAAIEKYMMLEDPDVQVKEWVSIVRELAYHIEDSIDGFIHKLGNSRRRHGGFKEFFGKAARLLKQLKHRHRIANQIKELQVRIKQVKDLKSSYKLDDIVCSTSGHAAVDPRLCAYFAEEANLVGVDGPRDELAEWMVREENSLAKNPKVLSIVGFGGLGKTTLAKEVYRKIQDQFHYRAFVSVSQNPDIRKIFKDVISQVSEDESVQDTNNWDERKYITKLRQLLQDKR